MKNVMIIIMLTIAVSIANTEIGKIIDVIAAITFLGYILYNFYIVNIKNPKSNIGIYEINELYKDEIKRIEMN